MNYNYSNFTNPHQYTSYGKNLPLKAYISNPQNKMIRKKIIINKNNNSNNHKINNNKTFNNII